MKVLILTEGGKNIGFGHLTRCLSVCQAFEKRGILPEFVVNGDKTVEEFLKNKKCKNFNWLKEKDRLLASIEGVDTVIIDSYLASFEFYKKVSELVKIPVYIDDNKRLDYPKGVVVNGAIYAEEINYHQKRDITYLLGPKYLPLRKEFWNVTEKEIRDEIESILITFGGNDAKNMTLKVIAMLIECFPKIVKNVVIGKGFKNVKEIEKYKNGKTNLIYYPNAEEIKNVMFESDVAISSGGVTLYELARVGVPTISIAVADNQLNNVKRLAEKGFIEYAGWMEDKNLLDHLLEKLELLKNKDLRKEKAKIGKTMVDGSGAVKIASFCIKKYLERGLVLREADVRDTYSIYSLSNEPDVRQSSFNTEKIELESHKKWFIDRLKDKNCLFLVGEINNNFLGQIRFNLNRDEAVISISVRNKYRGLGRGSIFIRKSLDYLKLKNPNIKKVKAYIKEKNFSSMKFFERSNFHFENKTIVNGHNALEYSHEFGRK